MTKKRIRNTISIAVIGSMIFVLILVLGTIKLGRSATTDTLSAVETVSLFYLDELAGRREQVVAQNLNKKLEDMNVALSLMTEDDLVDMEHLQSYQARMRRIYNLDKFAFVDEDGLIYTSMGTLTNIDDYAFDYLSISEPEISILNIESDEKKVVIAIPLQNLDFEGKRFCVCFMEIDMQEMLHGVSMSSDDNNSTFCNIYTHDGIALSNTVLGGLAVEDNLLEALKTAEFTNGTYENVEEDFTQGRAGVVTFTYNGVRETLSYVPVDGTDWMLTYLIRETVIADKISSVSESIIFRSLMQSALAAVVLIGMFVIIIYQIRQNAKLAIEKESSDAENRVKQEQMQERLELQSRLLEEEKRRSQQDNMITAMSADYRSVYYINLDKDEGICYRGDPNDDEQTKEGVTFPYLNRFTWYANNSVDESYRQGFLDFIDPDRIREGLSKEPILAYRYLARRSGKEYYEMIRVAGVRSAEERKDDHVHAIGLGFTVIDAEMRRNMEQQQILADALDSAEQANKAKTSFLSNMSHEIRTPLNAIIGLDNIAMNDPETSEKTKEYLTKIDTAAEHLLILINDILDMSRIESGRMVLRNEEFSFVKMLESINNMFSGQCLDKGLNYSCYTSGQIDDYYIGDNMKLRQVLINIIGNAVKFTPEGGNVCLDIKRAAKFEDKTTLQFTITDNGIGMSREFLPHIFDTFAQEDATTANRYGSSGLGLAIAKNIVEMMNGTIEVESEKGVGTTFKVTITLTDSAHSNDGVDDEASMPENIRVLVIDDDPIACEHAKLILEKVGITTDIAPSGQKGLEMVKLHHARHEAYNLILVDLKMEEMDGVDTTRRIRSVVGNEAAIIILTAYKWDDVLEEAIEAGVDGFLAKPLFATTVLEEFKSALKKKLESAPARVELNLEGHRIMVAEDVDINAQILKNILESKGAEVDIVENGRIAVDAFTSHQEGYYSVVLMDIRMPEMDGIEATKLIRASGRADAETIPIIALTANAFDEDVQRSLQAGLNAHLNKPIRPEILFDTLASFINAK